MPFHMVLCVCWTVWEVNNDVLKHMVSTKSCSQLLSEFLGSVQLTALPDRLHLVVRRSGIAGDVVKFHAILVNYVRLVCDLRSQVRALQREAGNVRVLLLGAHLSRLDSSP